MFLWELKSLLRQANDELNKRIQEIVVRLNAACHKPRHSDLESPSVANRHDLPLPEELPQLHSRVRSLPQRFFHPCRKLLWNQKRSRNPRIQRSQNRSMHARQLHEVPVRRLSRALDPLRQA